MTRHDVYLSLGSNVGDRKANLTAALGALGRHADIVRVSSIYETEPVGFSHQPPFLNLVCRASTSLTPRQLLTVTQRIETDLGRLPGFRNGPRVIDIDILLYGDLCLREETLTIPHPAMPDRLFVLAPLAEVAPAVVHPELHKTISQLLKESTDTHWVRIAIGGEDVPAVC